MRSAGSEEWPGRMPSVAWRAAVLFVFAAACSTLGPPPMEPLTASTLAAAERRWQAHGTDSYRLVVRVRAPRYDPAVYDLIVDHGIVARVERDGRPVPRDDLGRSDYTVSGLFRLLREDLRLADVAPGADAPPIDLRVRFEPETGRLLRYRRTVGSARRRVLMVEVIRYEPLAGAPAHHAA
jgi:hypothetical protein